MANAPQWLLSRVLGRHRLSLKLAGFFLLVSLPTLIVVESALLMLEFQQFTADVGKGRLRAATAAEARRLATQLTAAADPAQLQQELAAWLDGLALPGATAVVDSAVLQELSDQPFAAALRLADGRVIRAPMIPGGWQIAAEPLALPGPSAVIESARQQSPVWMRRYAAPVAPKAESPALLVLELRLPLPWHRVVLSTSKEWPVLVGFLLVFSLVTLWFFGRSVTVRLHRIAAAADAWRGGNFAVVIGDRSADELGVLSAALDQMAGELKQLVHARSQLATLNERQRLARDLHDTVKQKAFALSLQLAAMRSSVAGASSRASLAQCEQLAADIQHELVAILDELQSADSDASAWGQVIEQRLREWARLGNLTVDWQLPAAEQVDPRHRDTLIRLVDEAMSNIYRHSGATQVQVELTRQGDCLHLRVRDNGRGMALPTGGGQGLCNMRVRAAALPGGTLTINGADGVEINLHWAQSPAVATAAGP